MHPNGVEPSRHCWHKNLNLACLPISPRVREKAVMYTHPPKTSQRPKPKKSELIKTLGYADLHLLHASHAMHREQPGKQIMPESGEQ